MMSVGMNSLQDICRDIRRLDNAKSHLTATITAFRRLSMLVTAVGAFVSREPKADTIT